MKKDLYEQLSRLGKAVASPARLQLLDLLCQGPRTVESLAREADLTLRTRRNTCASCIRRVWWKPKKRACS